VFALQNLKYFTNVTVKRLDVSIIFLSFSVQLGNVTVLYCNALNQRGLGFTRDTVWDISIQVA